MKNALASRQEHFFCNNIDVDQTLQLLSVVFISTEMTKYVDVKP